MTKSMTPQEYLEYLPSKYVSMAMDEDLGWFAYTETPAWLVDEWSSDGCYLQVCFTIDYTGDAEDSLVTRTLTFGDLENGDEFWHNGKKWTKKTHMGKATRTVSDVFVISLEVTRG